MIRRMFSVSLLAVVALSPSAARANDLVLPARRFQSGDRLVSASVFHWFTSSGGQLTGPWRPVEGRANWTGETDFWVRQIKDLMDAKVDVMYVHLYPGMEQQRINLFAALKQLRNLGYEVPKAVPFLDTEITWYVHPPFPDVSTTAGKDTWVAQYIRYFNQYFGENPDAEAAGFIGIMNGRVMLDTWHMQNVVNYSQLTRNDVESRLIAAFGATRPEFNSGVYQVATAYGSYYPSWCDELAYQFCTNSYYLEWSGSPQVRSYTVKGGYWDQNIRDPGTFMARDGGTHYVSAWQSVLNDSSPSRRVYIESWNEYDEGSGIYSADPGPPYIVPPNPNNDTWSSTSNPREYIDTTATYAAQFNKLPQRDARFLTHNIPALLFLGETVNVQMVVRNEGNNEWSGAAGYKLGLQGPVLYEGHFDGDAQGWTLVKNAFGTSGNTAYENGDWNAGYGFSGGGLRTRTGNVDGVTYTNGASTAWSKTIYVAQTSNIAINFKWRLVFPAAYDSGENGEARLEVDNQLYGLDGQTYLARFAGGTGVDQDTGWRNCTVTPNLTGPANHTIEIGGWNNRKSSSDECMDVYIDDVVLIDADTGPPFGPYRVLLDDNADEIPTYGGIFRGRPKTFSFSLTAPSTPGDYQLNFQMLQEYVAWFGESLRVPVKVVPAAVNPSPPDGAINISPAATLSWTAGLGATGHEVYFGVDRQAVDNADPQSSEYVGQFPLGAEQYDPPGLLEQGTTFYWRVDELQAAGPPVKGHIWSFTTRIIRGDFDRDHDVDMEDFGFLQRCLSGSNIPYLKGCAAADLDTDGDVDQTDLNMFVPCLSGANRLSGC